MTEANKQENGSAAVAAPLMAGHTPGPWTESGTAVYAGDKMIASVYGDHPECKYDARMQANAHLLAAAPDLLAALRPFARARIAYVQAYRNFLVDGNTSAERRFSEGERKETAEEAAYEALAEISFDELVAVVDAIAKAEGPSPLSKAEV